MSSPAPTELDSSSVTEMEEEEKEEGPLNVILPVDADTPNESPSIMPTLPVQAGTPNGAPSSMPSIMEIIEDSLPDDRMNGSVMPNLTETQEADLRRAQQPPRRVWAVRDILAMQPQPTIIRVRSPALLHAGDGMLAVAGAMRSIMAPPSSTDSEHIEWSLPNANDNHFDHCHRIINNIQVVFYIGITEDPNGRWEKHNADQTVGPEPNMVVLIEAESSRLTAALEIQLLAQYLPHMRCANRSSGGEGASAGSPHYLYVLRASSPLLRRSR